MLMKLKLLLLMSRKEVVKLQSRLNQGDFVLNFQDKHATVFEEDKI